MKLLDLLMSAWAILPDQLREIQAIYAAHLRGDKIDIEAIEARLGRPLANEQQDYEIRQGGVAVLTLDGVMAPKANLFMRVSGGVSTQMAGLQIESAMADPRVTAMVLAIDSPGGSVFGTPELGATVRELSAIKPIVTVSEATLAGAAVALDGVRARWITARVTSGERRASPPATARIPSARTSGREFFSRKPLAPAESAAIR